MLENVDGGVAELADDVVVGAGEVVADAGAETLAVQVKLVTLTAGRVVVVVRVAENVVLLEALT